ncbi:MAG: hypothetical protein JWN27_326 [Candidatus Eremiobacteraeota bacterium]|nr:hypothetical protein [Candidatus Eremiobacteraeota bacterium]
MKTKFSLLAFGLAAAIPLAVAAEPATGPGAGAGAPETRAQIERARTEARTAVFADLSADHRAQVQAIVDKLNAGTLTNPVDAAKQIDAILTPDETKAVLAERAKAAAGMHRGGPDGAGPPPGGPPPGAPPQPGGPPPGAPGMRPGGSAGGFIVRVSVAPEKLHEMMRAMRDAAEAPPQPH